VVRFAPRLPEDWERPRFRIAVRGQQVEVDMAPGATTYSLLEGTGLLLEHHGEELRLAPGTPLTRGDSLADAA
jgi:alpha,alpha-trehalose phosphorylase